MGAAGSGRGLCSGCLAPRSGLRALLVRGGWWQVRAGFCVHVRRHVHADHVFVSSFRFSLSTAVRAPAGVWCVLVVLVVSCGSETGTSPVGVCTRLRAFPIYGVAGACWCFWTGRVDLTASFF